MITSDVDISIQPFPFSPNMPFSKGIMRFMVGLAKKAILANSCASVADALFPSGHKAIVAIPAGGLWIGLLFYMLQIYLDFSAYSDMAIGMGWMIGFHYNENFNYPYIATSIKDFWNRWHINVLLHPVAFLAYQAILYSQYR